MLSKWTNDVHRMDKKMLSLIVLAHASDVLENAFAPLSDQDYEVIRYTAFESSFVISALDHLWPSQCLLWEKGLFMRFAGKFPV